MPTVGAGEGKSWTFRRVLTHGLTYLAALALPLWLLGEQLLAWWTLRKAKIEKAEPKTHLEVVEERRKGYGRKRYEGRPSSVRRPAAGAALSRA